MLSTHLPTNNSVLDSVLNTHDLRELEKMETLYCLKPNDQVIDYHIDYLRKITDFFGTIEALLDEDRKDIKQLATHLFKAVARVEKI